MRRMLTAAAVAAVLLAAGCSGRAGTPAMGHTSATGHATLTLRLGFVTSITQAPALTGIREKFFAVSLAPRVALRALPFRTDAAEAAALATGKLDAAYATPATILSLARAHPASFRIISGSASSGSELVTTHRIRTPARLNGTTLAVPAAGSDQDIALRYWLRRHHLAATGPGHVTITAVPDGRAVVTAFKAGRIDGAWETAPYDAEMLAARGNILAAQASQYPAASLIVTSAFLARHTAAVLGLLKGQIRANDYIHHNLVAAIQAAAGELKAITGTRIPSAVLADSFAQITYTNDPVAASMAAQARHAALLGLPHPVGSITTLYDLTPLNLLLRQDGEPPVGP